MASEGVSYEFSVGPVHPALKEPLRLDLTLEGEKVTAVDFELSQVHRGIEWLATGRNPVQILYLAERVCGICSICHMLAFSRAVEAAAGIEVPPRAQYIRTVVAELERIHSHLLWAGVAAHELGFDSVMHYTWRARENVLDTVEYLTGNRISKAMVTIGGVRRDFGDKQLARIGECIGFYRKCFGKLEGILLRDRIIRSRTRDVGVLTRKDALALCAVGPTARASGVMKDVRHDEPYAAYQDLDIKPVMPEDVLGETRGDVYDRIAVRVHEIRQSADIIGACVKGMPPGKIRHEDKSAKILASLLPVKGEGIGRHEAPRGEVFHYIRMAGQEAPSSWKIKAPTYSNLLSWVPMLKGAQVADIPIIAASIDPCMSCTNRAVAAGGKDVLGNDALRRLSVEKTRELRRSGG